MSGVLIFLHLLPGGSVTVIGRGKECTTWAAGWGWRHQSQGDRDGEGRSRSLRRLSDLEFGGAVVMETNI